MPVAEGAAAPVVPVAAAAGVDSVAPDEILASVRTNFASADAAALLAPGAADVPVVPAAVEPAVPVVPVAAVLVAAGALGLAAVFAAEFDGAARRHPVTVTVFSLLALVGCVEVVCGVGVCAAITAVAHAAIAAHKLV